MVYESDARTIAHLSDLLDRAQDVEVKKEVKALLTKIFDKIKEAK